MTITPRLIVPSASEAIEFLSYAFGAREVERFYDDALGRTVHAAVSIDGAVLALADAYPEYDNHAPESLGGTPVLVQLTTADPDAAAARAVERGAKIIFPVADQFYGKREGRVEDPFGHVWILSKEIEKLDPEEIQRRMHRFHGTPG